MNSTNTGRNGQAQTPETEVKPKAKRRRFGAEYKRRILREVAACTKAGELGALLRREGLYFSHLSSWRGQAERGELVGESKWPLWSPHPSPFAFQRPPPIFTPPERRHRRPDVRRGAIRGRERGGAVDGDATLSLLRRKR